MLDLHHLIWLFMYIIFTYILFILFHIILYIISVKQAVLKNTISIVISLRGKIASMLACFSLEVVIKALMIHVWHRSSLHGCSLTAHLLHLQVVKELQTSAQEAILQLRAMIGEVCLNVEEEESAICTLFNSLQVI